MKLNKNALEFSLHISSYMLESLHWLPLLTRFQLKVLKLIYWSSSVLV